MTVLFIGGVIVAWYCGKSILHLIDEGIWLIRVKIAEAHEKVGQGLPPVRETFPALPTQPAAPVAPTHAGQCENSRISDEMVASGLKKLGFERRAAADAVQQARLELGRDAKAEDLMRRAMLILTGKGKK